MRHSRSSSATPTANGSPSTCCATARAPFGSSRRPRNCGPAGPRPDLRLSVTWRGVWRDEGQRLVYPAGEGVVGGDAVGGDEHPAGRGAAAHVEGPCGGVGQGAAGAGRAQVHQQLVSPDAAAHVAPDQERQPAEHLLLGRCLPGGGQDSAQPLGEVWVEGHRCSPSRMIGGGPRGGTGRQGGRARRAAALRLPYLLSNTSI